jgi:hypothetical protein
VTLRVARRFVSGSCDTTELVEAVLARARQDGGIDLFEAQSRQAHDCSHPVRLTVARTSSTPSPARSPTTPATSVSS